jgi:hypothetical protein
MHPEAAMHTLGQDDATTSGTEVRLCLTSPIAWSMTPRQVEVFRTLLTLQLEQGHHSLLPDVVEALLALARRPWWDRGVADLPYESESEPGLPA